MTNELISKLKDLAISETGFVFDPYSGATFSANATGIGILEGLREGLDRDGLVERLAESFEVSGADLHRDIDDFLHVLRKHGIVPAEFHV